MLRSDFLMKVMSVVLFFAVAAYIGIYIFHSASNKLETTAAVRYTLEESGAAEGYVVRSETVLTGGDGIVSPMAGDGEKVGAGQAVAVCYGGETALERASEILELQMQIKEAKSARSASSALSATDIEDCVLALSEAVRHRNFDNLTDLTYGVKNNVFTGAGKITDEDLAALELRLDSLLGETANSRTVYAPMSGIFTSVVDGYENLTPDVLGELPPSSFQSVLKSQQIAPDALGKLVTDITWYYASVMDASEAEKLEDKATATLLFKSTYYDEMEMTIDRVSEAADGRCVVVFSAKRSLAEMLSLRALTAEVKFTSCSGLYIPEKAVYFDDKENGPYIYLLTGSRAEKVAVEILGPAPDGYVVRDGAENATVIREAPRSSSRAKSFMPARW
jgi:hypothetical protein